MQPQQHELERVAHLLGLRHEHPLEDARHMADVELVVEVEGGLSELAGDALVQHERRLHHLLALVDHLWGVVSDEW